MINLRNTIGWIGILLASSAPAAGWQLEKCSPLADAAPAKLLAYLQENRLKQDDACVAFAIRELGRQRYSPATSTLVKYLDFRSPELSRDRPIRVGPLRTVIEIYPAAAALDQIGKQAAPHVAWAVGDPSASELTRSNASQLLLLIYPGRTSDAVDILVRTSRAATDRVASQRLIDAAKELASHCSQPSRQACMKALNQ